MTPSEVFEEIKSFIIKGYVLQEENPFAKRVGQLLEFLDDYIVTIETNGSVSLKSVELKNPKHSYVMDMKVPSSGCSDQMLFENFDLLRDNDEIKFVIGSRVDYDWAKNIISKYHKKEL